MIRKNIKIQGFDLEIPIWNFMSANIDSSGYMNVIFSGKLSEFSEPIVQYRHRCQFFQFKNTDTLAEQILGDIKEISKNDINFMA